MSRAVPTIRTATPVFEEGAAAHRNPAFNAVDLADDAIFAFVIVLVVRVERLFDGFLGALLVLRMQRAAKDVEIGRRILGQPPQRPHPRIEQHLAGDEVPVPDAGAPGVERELHAFERKSLFANEVAAGLRRRVRRKISIRHLRPSLVKAARHSPSERRASHGRPMARRNDGVPWTPRAEFTRARRQAPARCAIPRR